MNNIQNQFRCELWQELEHKGNNASNRIDRSGLWIRARLNNLFNNVRFDIWLENKIAEQLIKLARQQASNNKEW